MPTAASTPLTIRTLAALLLLARAGAAWVLGDVQATVANGRLSIVADDNSFDLAEPRRVQEFEDFD